MKASIPLFGNFKRPWNILFFGTDKFSLHVLQALNENRMAETSKSCVVGKLCIAHPQMKKMSPVNKYSDFCGLLQYEWPFRRGFRGFDVGVLASFGHLIPGKIINMFPNGIINVHPSLLPRWRGAAPLHHTILQGDTTTGVSIMSLEPKHFDRGRLLLQDEVPVPSRATTHSLRDTLGQIGGKMTLEALCSLPELLLTSQPQEDQAVTYAHKVDQSVSYIDWKHQTCDEIDRQYRALHQSMELRSEWMGAVVRLLDMVNPNYKPCMSLDAACPPGLPVFSKQDQILWVKCKDGWVGFRNIMIKKKMTAKSFHNGYLSKQRLQGVVLTSVPNNLFNQSYNNWIQNPRAS